MQASRDAVAASRDQLPDLQAHLAHAEEEVASTQTAVAEAAEMADEERDALLKRVQAAQTAELDAKTRLDEELQVCRRHRSAAQPAAPPDDALAYHALGSRAEA